MSKFLRHNIFLDSSSEYLNSVEINDFVIIILFHKFLNKVLLR